MIESLKKVGKKIWAAVMLGIIVVGGFLLQFNADGTVTFCNPKGECVKFTPEEYVIARNGVIAKVRTGQPLEYDEYEFLVKIYDHELRKKNSIRINDVDFSDNKGSANLEKLNQALSL